MFDRLYGVTRIIAACGVVAAMTAGGNAFAAGEKVSGTLGYSYNSHFMSYGADVWGGGNDFFGTKSTSFVDTGVTVNVTDAFSMNVGIWADYNNNAADTLGGNIQEVDWWIGGSYTIGIASLSATYQRWNYASDVEEIVDLAVGIDDSSYLGKFALSPTLTWHIRTDGNGTQDQGSAMVLSIGPSVGLTEGISLTFPAGIGFFLNDNFQGGTDGGYAYSYIGASLGVPLSFIPAAYGEWAVNFDVIAYFTEKDAIPNNPKENFVTGSVGLRLNF